MKTTHLFAALLVGGSLLAAAGVARADPTERESGKILNQNAPERYVYVTGSNIPQKVHLRSIGTDTPYNIRIYSRRELESTGRQTPGEALATLDPSLQLSGR
ncbi:MAG: hypothetical protein M3Y86_08050 [Verrucomicrobiota bacterium]|nr:hypothetical protein [Verrucomicrobiota bacterium]